jgi:hypothetical protein
MRVLFKMFRSSMSTWEVLFAEAAEFAGELPSRRLINISHSADNSDGVVTVWYWGEDDGPTRRTDDYGEPVR